MCTMSLELSSDDGSVAEKRAAIRSAAVFRSTTLTVTNDSEGLP